MSLHNYSLKFFKSYVDFKSSFDLYENFKNLINRISEEKDLDYENTNIEILLNQDKNLIIENFKTLGNILNIEFKIKDKITSFKNLLTEISEYHVHSMSLNNKYYSCEYHQESLFVHLTLVTLISLSHTINDKDLSLKMSFMSLLHDIGKYGTVGVSNIWTKFPFHGEMGSGILLSAFKELKFREYFSETDLEDISRSICVHMCGYHETKEESIDTKYKWSLLRIENDKVKDYLYYLSFGDHFGALRLKKHRTDPKEFLESRSKFKTFINQDFDIKQFYENYDLENLLIIVRGLQNTGKTYLTNNLKEHFNNNCLIITSENLTEIKDHLKDHKIIILDSSKPLYPEFNQMISKDDLILKKYFVLSIDIVSDFHNMFNWLHDQRINYRDLTSLSTTSKISSIKNPLKPRLCHVVTWYNGKIELFRQLDIFKGLFI